MIAELTIPSDCGVSPLPFETDVPPCIDVDDLSPQDYLPGGRTAVVTPYKKGTSVCSGQYGQFQVLNGMGGQIHRALYLGKSVEKVDGQANPGIKVTVDCSDRMYADTAVDGGPNGDKGLAIRDRGRWYVVKLAQGSSGGGVSLYYGMVLGGNPLVAGSPVRQFLNPVPMFTEDKSALLVSPTVDDWTAFDLPASWDVEDSFTAEQETPLGLGYVQLLRPSSWGGKSWTSAFALPIDPGEQSDTNDPPTVLAATYKNAPTVELVWSHGSMAVPLAQMKAKILLTVPSGAAGSQPLPALMITAVTASAGKITLTLNRTIAAAETVKVSVLAGVWKTGAVPPLLNEDQEIDAVRAIPLGAVVMAISNVSLQGFVVGDFVVMADMGTSLTDSNSVSRPVLDILYAINPNRLPHSHQSYGNGPTGGGPANFNFIGVAGVLGGG